MSEFLTKPRSIWPWLWGAWFLLFCILEGVAVKDERGGDTLTEQVSWIGGWAPVLFLAAFLIFVAWLANHFIGKKSRIWFWRKEREIDSQE